MKRLLTTLIVPLALAQTVGATPINHLVPPPPPPPITTMLDSVNVWSDDGMVTFSLTFHQTPDFYNIDAFDRPQSSFQFYLSSDPNVDHPMKAPVIVVRGDDIHHGAISACTAQPYGSGCSGGWGVPVGFAQPSIDGSTVTFQLDAGVLPDLFNYDVLALEFGKAGYMYSGALDGGDAIALKASALPPVETPETDALVLVGIGMIAVAGKRWAA